MLKRNDSLNPGMRIPARGIFFEDKARLAQIERPSQHARHVHRAVVLRHKGIEKAGGAIEGMRACGGSRAGKEGRLETIARCEPAMQRLYHRADIGPDAGRA
jgi:hypothetical protein